MLLLTFPFHRSVGKVLSNEISFSIHVAGNQGENSERRTATAPPGMFTFLHEKSFAKCLLCCRNLAYFHRWWCCTVSMHARFERSGERERDRESELERVGWKLARNRSKQWVARVACCVHHLIGLWCLWMRVCFSFNSFPPHWANGTGCFFCVFLPHTFVSTFFLLHFVWPVTFCLMQCFYQCVPTELAGRKKKVFFAKEPEISRCIKSNYFIVQSLSAVECRLEAKVCPRVYTSGRLSEANACPKVTEDNLELPTSEGATELLRPKASSVQASINLPYQEHLASFLCCVLYRSWVMKWKNKNLVHCPSGAIGNGSE